MIRFSRTHQASNGRLIGAAAMAAVVFTSASFSAGTFASGGSKIAKAKQTAEAPAALVAGPALDVPGGRYGLDKTHGYVTFGYSHLGFSNPEVGFNDFDVDLTLDPKSPEASSLSVSINAESVDSRVEKFDNHLKGADYFDVANHKVITFVSEKISMTSANTADITGLLTIKGQSHPVTLAAVLNKAGTHPLAGIPALGVSATATLNRSQWGLDKYVPMVSDEVQLRIEVELPQAQK